MSETKRVGVVAHAVERARERFRIDGTHAQITAYIEAEVRAGIEAGRILNHKPRSWRLYGEKGRNLAPFERFVWNATDDRAWIVLRTPTEDVVKTSLSPTGGVRRIERKATARR